MGSGKSDRRSLWLRLPELLRLSAWLPPGLALAWLATLVTLVHSVGSALAVWGATLFVVVLAALVVRVVQRRASRHKGTPLSAAKPTAATDEVEASAPTPPSLTAGPKSETPTAVAMLVSQLQVLTAEEVASVLRVDIGQVISSISKGELPGNRLGSHWRVDHGALVRWLQGPYGDLAENDPNR